MRVPTISANNSAIAAQAAKTAPTTTPSAQGADFTSTLAQAADLPSGNAASTGERPSVDGRVKTTHEAGKKQPGEGARDGSANQPLASVAPVVLVSSVSLAPSGALSLAGASSSSPANYGDGRSVSGQKPDKAASMPTPETLKAPVGDQLGITAAEQRLVQGALQARQPDKHAALTGTELAEAPVPAGAIVSRDAGLAPGPEKERPQPEKGMPQPAQAPAPEAPVPQSLSAIANQGVAQVGAASAGIPGALTGLAPLQPGVGASAGAGKSVGPGQSVARAEGSGRSPRPTMKEAASLPAMSQGVRAQPAGNGGGSAAGNGSAGQSAGGGNPQVVQVTAPGIHDGGLPAHVLTSLQGQQAIATGDPAAGASSQGRSSEGGGSVPAAGAGEGAANAQALPSINTARVIQSMQGSEMRVGMHSVEFGSVSISTSMTHQTLAAQISFEHADLGRALTAHLPAMEARLSSEYGMQTRVEVRDGSMGAFAESGRDGSEQQRRQGGGAARSAEGVAPLMAAQNHGTTTAAEETSGMGRVDIRI